MRLHLLVVAACAGAFPTYVSREKDGAEAVPPKPAYYAHKDRSSRDRFAAVAAGAAPKNFTTLEALAYAQFRSPICHSVAHALGRRVYAEARGAFATPADRLDAALAACEYRCTGGCLHGAVAAYAVAAPATVDIPSTCARASMRRILPFGECAHAAGHALALTLSEGAAFAACDAQRRDPSVAHYCAGGVIIRAAKESEIPNFKVSDLGHFPLVSADFWTSDHLSERSRSVDAFFGTRARETLTLKRR